MSAVYVTFLFFAASSILHNELQRIWLQFMIQSKFFNILSLRIFGKFSLGYDYSKSENRNIAYKLNHIVKFGSNIIGKHIIFNIPLFNILPSVKYLNKSVQEVDNHIDSIIDERLKDIDNNKTVPIDILSTLSTATNDAETGTITNLPSTV